MNSLKYLGKVFAVNVAASAGVITGCTLGFVLTGSAVVNLKKKVKKAFDEGVETAEDEMIVESATNVVK